MSFLLYSIVVKNKKRRSDENASKFSLGARHPFILTKKQLGGLLRRCVMWKLKQFYDIFAIFFMWVEKIISRMDKSTSKYIGSLFIKAGTSLFLLSLISISVKNTHGAFLYSTKSIPYVGSITSEANVIIQATPASNIVFIFTLSLVAFFAGIPFANHGGKAQKSKRQKANKTTDSAPVGA